MFASWEKACSFINRFINPFINLFVQNKIPLSWLAVISRVRCDSAQILTQFHCDFTKNLSPLSYNSFFSFILVMTIDGVYSNFTRDRATESTRIPNTGIRRNIKYNKNFRQSLLVRTGLYDDGESGRTGKYDEKSCRPWDEPAKMDESFSKPPGFVAKTRK